MSLQQFLSMGGYAFYVWTAYGLVLGMLALNLIAPLRRKASVQKNIVRMLQRERSRP